MPGDGGDILVKMSIDDGEVADELDQQSRRAEQAGLRMESGFAGVGRKLDQSFDHAGSKIDRFVFGLNPVAAIMYGIGASAGIASKSIAQYSEMNETARQLTGDLGREIKGLWSDIGRNIFGATGYVTDFVKIIREGYNYLQRGVKGDAYIAALKADEESQKTAKQNANFGDESRKADLAIATAAGDQGAVARLNAEIRLDEKRKQIAKEVSDEVISQAQSQELLNKAQREYDAALSSSAAKAREQIELTNADARAKREAAEAAELAANIEAVRNNRVSLDTLRFEAKGEEIRLMRLENRKKEADIAEVMLGYAERVNALEKDTALTEADRTQQREKFLALRDRELGLINAKSYEEPTTLQTMSIATGFAVGALPARVFGPGGGSGTAQTQKQQLDRLSSIDTTLKRIEGKSGTAVFGN